MSRLSGKSLKPPGGSRCSGAFACAKFNASETREKQQPGRTGVVNRAGNRRTTARMNPYSPAVSANSTRTVGGLRQRQGAAHRRPPGGPKSATIRRAWVPPQEEFPQWTPDGNRKNPLCLTDRSLFPTCRYRRLRGPLAHPGCRDGPRRLEAAERQGGAVSRSQAGNSSVSLTCTLTSTCPQSTQRVRVSVVVRSTIAGS